MPRENRTPAAGISNQEVLAEINLITQIQQIETRLVFQPDTIRFAQLADAYLSIGEFDGAILACEEGLKLYPYDDTASFILAKADHRRGDKKKARAILQDFLASYPAHLTAHKLLGDLALEEDDIVHSVSHYRIALRMDPINRPIIQSLVDLKEPYQKIKATKSGDDDEEDVRPPVLNKVIPKPVPKPEIEKSPVKVDARNVVEEELLKVEEFGIEETKPVEPKPVVSQPPVKQAVDVVKPVHKPAYTDEKGLMYFYDDDEVSFEEYKQRQEWQKAGKALILSRETLDAKLALAGAKAAEEKPELKKPAVSDQKIPSSFEEHLENAMSKEEEELLSEAEQDDGLARIDISYKDYLDLLTEESDLIEALFQDEDETGEQEISAKADRTAEVDRADEERPMVYQDYVEDLTEENEINEASFIADYDDRILNLTEYSEYLEYSDDVMDIETYTLISRNGDLNELTKEVVPTDEGGTMTYREYFSALSSDTERGEAALEKSEVEVEKADIKVKRKIKSKEPVIEKTAEKIDAKETAEISEAGNEEPTTQTRGAVQQPAEKVSGGSEEAVEKGTAFVDPDQINPQDATPELVDDLAARGQYGSAYKVCKMLKAKNPTDAKIDRKILELKRLYLWSSQLVG